MPVDRLYHIDLLHMEAQRVVLQLVEVHQLIHQLEHSLDATLGNAEQTAFLVSQ